MRTNTRNSAFPRALKINACGFFFVKKQHFLVLLRITFSLFTLKTNGPVHEILLLIAYMYVGSEASSGSKGSDEPVHMHSLTRALRCWHTQSQGMPK